MRKVLDHKNVAPSALTQIESFHINIVKEVESAVSENDYVIVGMAYNPHCSKARALLTAKGISHKYIGYGGYFSMWKPRLALKLWAGWPTFPMVFVKGQLIGGRRELVQYLEKQSQ